MTQSLIEMYKDHILFAYSLFFFLLFSRSLINREPVMTAREKEEKNETTAEYGLML